jgi:para-aminobenzoate synthetase component 1
VWREHNISWIGKEKSKSRMLQILEIPYQDPISLFLRIKERPYAFFLESSMRHPKTGNLSFLGSDPFLVLKSKGEVIEIVEDGVRKRLSGDPFRILQSIILEYGRELDASQIDCGDRALPSFLAGGVGYLGYDLCHFIEKLPSKALDDLDIPDCVFCFYDAVVLVNHKRRRSYISSTGLPIKANIPRAKLRAKDRLEEVRDAIFGEGSCEGSLNIEDFLVPPVWGLESNFTKATYIDAVTKVKRYIAKGDVYQVNLSQRFSAPFPFSSFSLYKRLREVNPAPFSAFLNLGDISIVSASPERFLKVDGGVVETRPIKGTRPRGRTGSEDRRLRQELRMSEKDRAELVMIVDLLRNDLGRVCVYNSIKVKRLIEIEVHPTVFHSVSTITGKLREGCGRVELLRACFPGGSITGAPKIRAMEIIDELEPTRRGIYTGSIGYIDFFGGMDLNIAIRTFLVKQGRVYFQVGGGVVWDSDPELEYLETLHKGEGLIRALNLQKDLEAVSRV